MFRPALRSAAAWAARSAEGGHGPAVTEGDLLTRFARTRDDAAFAELAEDRRGARAVPAAGSG